MGQHIYAGVTRRIHTFPSLRVVFVSVELGA